MKRLVASSRKRNRVARPARPSATNDRPPAPAIGPERRRRDGSRIQAALDIALRSDGGIGAQAVVEDVRNSIRSERNAARREISRSCRVYQLVVVVRETASRNEGNPAAAEGPCHALNEVGVGGPAHRQRPEGSGQRPVIRVARDVRKAEIEGRQQLRRRLTASERARSDQTPSHTYGTEQRPSRPLVIQLIGETRFFSER